MSKISLPLQTGRNPPAGSKEEAGKLGKNSKQEEIPQPEADRKQAGWVKSGGTGKTPQPEAKRKQAGWGENAGTGKTPQPEADRKQAGWVKNSKHALVNKFWTRNIKK